MREICVFNIHICKIKNQGDLKDPKTITPIISLLKNIPKET